MAKRVIGFIVGVVAVLSLPSIIGAQILPWNNAGNGNRGYVVYGLPRPQGSLSLSNVSQVLSDPAPTPATNGTARLTPINVITTNSFNVALNTASVTLSDGYRDKSADGSDAFLRFDGGLDLNASGTDNNGADPALGGYTVQLFRDDNGNGVLDAGDTYMRTIQTGGDGRYTITTRPERSGQCTPTSPSSRLARCRSSTRSACEQSERRSAGRRRRRVRLAFARR